MNTQSYNTKEIAARGTEIYETQLKSKMEPQHIGKYLVIDVETGEYEIDENGEAASRRAYEKKPDGLRFGMRIGHRAWGHLRFRSGKSAQ